MEDIGPTRKPMIVPPGQGRVYSMGPMQAVFKADDAESAGAYSISEWWLEPGTRGPPVHQHEDVSPLTRRLVGKTHTLGRDLAHRSLPFTR